MKKLPFLLSIPHGGRLTPSELSDKVCISRHDLFDDSDAYTCEIYDLADKVQSVCKATVARAFVDLNRTPSQIPPQFPDGIVKSMTCFAKPIYEGDFFPQGELFKLLLDKYYFPYHEKLRQLASSSAVWIAFDCHSMAEFPPPVSPDRGQPRPLLNLGNAFGSACDIQTVLALAESFMQVWGLKSHEISINSPFAGGHITRTHGRHPKPWIQIEMNRSLYLAGSYFDRQSLRADLQRLEEINQLFYETLLIFYEKISR